MDLQAPSPAASSSPPRNAISHASHDDRPSSSASHLELPSSSLVIGSDSLLQAPNLERHPKGKRKRTAAKDKAILEAAYAANPKPDKAARLVIVNRVSLNEKEVQIWFQNRRQNDRRKSRPLSPQEIAALRYGGMQILSSDPPAFNSSFSSDNVEILSAHAMSRPEPGVASPPHSDPLSSSSCDEVERTPDVRREPRRWADGEGRQGNELVTPAPKAEAAKETALQASQSQSSVGYLSNRWNAASSLVTPSTLRRPENDSFRLESFAQSSCSTSSPSGHALPPTTLESSQFRLSLSLDGKAEVVSSAPSPPRAIIPPPSSDDLQSLGPVRRLSLQRSHSASSPITLPPISVLTSSLPAPGSAPLPPRLTRGRSRDVHAWEFCCDAENREDFLTVQAKHESNGSAIAAITLLRSASGSGSPLQLSNSAKRNATASGAAPRSGLAKKPRLLRAVSSTAKLQSNSSATEERTVEKLNIPDKPKIMSQSGNDSDKENWSPDEDGNPGSTFSQPHPGMGVPRRRPLPSSPVRLDKKNPRRARERIPQGLPSLRATLGDRSNRAPAYSQAKRGGKRDQSPLEIYEDSESVGSGAPAPDDEVERFMRGEVSPSKKGDVDAVAGLLSLSQGNWR